MALLEDDRIRLRAIEPGDLDSIFKWENDTTIWSYGSTIAPFSKRQIYEYIRDYTGDIYSQRQLRFIIESKEGNEAVGMADLFDYDPFHNRAYIGLLIDKDFRNRRYGIAAAVLLMEYARDFIGIHQLITNIPMRNAASLSIFRKLNYSQTGVLKDWIRIGNEYHDVAVMQYLFS